MTDKVEIELHPLGIFPAAIMQFQLFEELEVFAGVSSAERRFDKKTIHQDIDTSGSLDVFG